VDDGVVFRSMKEFYWWVAIVTLIIFCLMGVSFAIIHINKQIKDMNALIVRLEEKDRKQKLLLKKYEDE
jgi:predicted membrane protein